VTPQRRDRRRIGVENDVDLDHHEKNRRILLSPPSVQRLRASLPSMPLPLGERSNEKSGSGSSSNNNKNNNKNGNVVKTATKALPRWMQLNRRTSSGDAVVGRQHHHYSLRVEDSSWRNAMRAPSSFVNQIPVQSDPVPGTRSKTQPPGFERDGETNLGKTHMDGNAKTTRRRDSHDGGPHSVGGSTTTATIRTLGTTTKRAGSNGQEETRRSKANIEGKNSILETTATMIFNIRSNTSSKGGASHRIRAPCQQKKATSSEKGEEEEEECKAGDLAPASGSTTGCKWRETVDPKSGRTYYYHVETRQSQWRKPMELASEEEREEARRKEEEQREFFRSMEANILRSIGEGAYASPKVVPARGDDGKKTIARARDGSGEAPTTAGNQGDDLTLEAASAAIKNMPRPGKLIRTISTMDEAVLRELVQRVPSHRQVLSHSSLHASRLPFDGEDASEQSPHDVITQATQDAAAQHHHPHPISAVPRARVQREASSYSTAASGLVSIVEADDDDSSSGGGAATYPSTSSPKQLYHHQQQHPLSRQRAAENWLMNSASTAGSTTAASGEDRNSRMSREASTTSACSLQVDDLFGSSSSSPSSQRHPMGSSSLLSSTSTNSSSFNMVVGNDATCNFGLSEEESGALEKLAAISSEMASCDVFDDDDGDLAGEDLLGDYEEDEIVACHRSLLGSPATGSAAEEPLSGSHQDIQYTPSPSVGAAERNRALPSSFAAMNMSEQPRDILYVPACSKGATTREGESTPKAGVDRPGLPRPAGYFSKGGGTGTEAGKESNSTALIREMQRPPALGTRRNTCGTLYVNSTMSAPDKDATIKVSDDE